MSVNAPSCLRLEGPARFEIGPAVAPGAAEAAAELAAWLELKSRNSALFDGPIVLAELDGTRVRARRGTYRTLATAEALGRMDVRALGVQAVVTGRTADGERCVLLGRRGSATRVYAGLWENAPAGGVEPPADGAGWIGEEDLLAALHAEWREELGVEPRGRARAVALLDDPMARSVDVVFEVDAGAAFATGCAAAGACGEYVDVAWVPVGKLGAWVQERPGAVSAPTEALLRRMRWVGAGREGAAERCPACGRELRLVEVHGHAQCAACGCNVRPCCQPGE